MLIISESTYLFVHFELSLLLLSTIRQTVINALSSKQELYDVC